MSKKLESRIRSAIRDLWMKSEPRKEALIRSRKPCTDGSRKKFVETCELCGKTAYIGEKQPMIKKNGEPGKKLIPVLVVHHLDHVPHVWSPDFLLRMFCDFERLQVLCQNCHNEIHQNAKMDNGE